MKRRETKADIAAKAQRAASDLHTYQTIVRALVLNAEASHDETFTIPTSGEEPTTIRLRAWGLLASHGGVILFEGIESFSVQAYFLDDYNATADFHYPEIRRAIDRVLTRRDEIYRSAPAHVSRAERAQVGS